MTTTTVPTDEINVDQQTQSRAATDDATIEEYADRWRAEEEFPPVELFYDGSEYHVGDGVHRILAARRAAIPIITANVHEGGLREAAIFACGANKTHGLKRSHADKRHAVATMLTLVPEWADNRIADHVGVHHNLVALVRRQLAESASCPVDVNLPTRLGRDGKRRKARAAVPSKQGASKMVTARETVQRIEAEFDERRESGAVIRSHREKKRMKDALAALVRALGHQQLFYQCENHLEAIIKVIDDA